MYTTIYTKTKENKYIRQTFNIIPKQINKLTYNQKQQIDKARLGVHKIQHMLSAFTTNYEEQYTQFQIPKKSGGLRTINAPKYAFKNALSTVKYILEHDIRCLPHPAAYAYIKNTSIKDALEKHQKNKSNWYLKIDIKDFFPSCTPELIYEQLIQLYPFAYLTTDDKLILKNSIKICCLNNGLPQGTPVSPLLTNLLMVPFDYKITEHLKTKSQKFVYTRYADDILISSKTHFNWQELQNEIQNILTPFVIKKEKTRYGSKAGRNWNLGLMLNKDNDITLGYRKKRNLNAALNNFIKDHQQRKSWDKQQTQVLLGQLSWLQQIEPNYYNALIQKYEAKYNIFDISNIFSYILKN